MKLVVATLGDGAYMFANPMVGHWVVGRAQAADPHHRVQQQPLRRRAPRHALDVQGRRRRRERRPHLADLDPSPPFEEMARAQGAHAERVEKPADLPEALARARAVVVTERKQALLNVITPY